MRALIDTLELRPGRAEDIDAYVRLSTGPIAGKRRFLIESLERRHVLAACVHDRVAGYIVWDRMFFGRAFVWLLGVDPEFRRRGIARALLTAFETHCAGEPLFTSTNESNHAMQALLSDAGYRSSGRLDNIDPGDAELFFFKHDRAAAVPWPR